MDKVYIPYKPHTKLATGKPSGFMSVTMSLPYQIEYLVLRYCAMNGLEPQGMENR
jgi:hypothetical protein